jgi:uncharacterized protein YeaO (DUF488 family)
MKLSTYQLGSPRQPGEGLRLGTVRFLPRGVKKTDYASRDFFDVWLPQLAPSPPLIAGLKSGQLTFATFSRKYRKELEKPEARHVIHLLAAVATQTPLAVGCYCDDESHCHRSVLRAVIGEAGG